MKPPFPARAIWALDYFYQGFLTKTGPLEDVLKRENLSAEEVAFIGDDLTDLPLLERVGLAATVPNAVPGRKRSGALRYPKKRR